MNDIELQKQYHPENFKSAEELELTEEELAELEFKKQEMQEYNPE